MKNLFNLKKALMIVTFTIISFIGNVAAQNKHAVAEGKYIIKCARNTTMVLDGTNVEKGENVKLRRRDANRKGQVWKVTRVVGPLGGYEIKCMDNDLFLDGDGIALTGSLLPGSDQNTIIKLQLWDRNIVGLRANQEWYIGKSDGYKTIFNVLNDKKYVDAKDDISNNSRVKLYNRNTSNHDKTQQWLFERVD